MRAHFIPLASLGIFSAGMATANSPAASLDAGLAAYDAIRFCTYAATRSQVDLPASYTLYTFAEGPAAGVYEARNIRTTASAPPLVQRFAKTTITGRFGQAHFAQVPANNGSVWVVFGGRVRGACDVMVTGVRDPDGLQTSLADRLGTKSRWTLVASTAASKAMALATAIYTQATPTPEAPSRGLRLRVEALRADLAKADGVQLDASIIAGNVQIKPDSTTVSR